jgi:hypothetical protein
MWSDIDTKEHAELFDEVERYLISNAGECDSTLIREVTRGLTCKPRSKDPIRLSLPPGIDAAWHVAMLNTVACRRFCMVDFEKVFEHTTVTEAESVEEKNTRVDNTVSVYHLQFGEDPPEDLWERETDFRVQEADRVYHVKL